MPTLTDSSSRAAASALSDELVRQSSAASGPLKFNATQSSCAATRVVSAVGADKLRTYGLLSNAYRPTSKTLDDVTMSKADATSVVDAFIDCLGASTFTRYLADAVTSSVQGANTASQRTCLQDKLTVTALKPMLINTLSGDKQAATQFYAGLLTCTKS
ncbi:MAG TPA: hypothetical protein VN108_09685 [Marmoricola sp.]|nr:hypothetical protein [Marmoricola sp.]